MSRWAAFLRRLRLSAAGAIACAGIIGLGVAARTVLQVEPPPPPPPAPAVIELQVTPRGDVYVDGVLKGQSPPLMRLEIEPGPHTVEIWNDPHPPLTMDINPAPAEVTAISHEFPVFVERKPPKPPKPPKRQASSQREKSWGEQVKDDVRRNARDTWHSFRREIGF